jgi:hypothetical protein
MADKRGWPWPALGLSSALHEAAYVIREDMMAVMMAMVMVERKRERERPEVKETRTYM